MAKTMIRYEGLQRRETYDEILGYLERGGGPGIDIAFPNRQASFIRNSPQYQNILTLDFVDLQQQQENMLKQQKRDIIVKEQSSNTSSMKSVLASESPSESLATQQLNSDFSSLGDADDIQYQHYASIDDYLKDMDDEEEEKKQRMAARGKQGMVDRIDAVTKLSEAFQASQATGYKPFVGTTGNKSKDEWIRGGQELDLLRVTEGENPPPYISEISKTNPQAVESFRASHGLFDPQSKAAASSSSGFDSFNIATPRAKSLGAKTRSRSTKGTKDETNDPETSVAKARGRPVDPNSARQKAMAKK